MVIRYAIRFPDGTYSNGPIQASVPLDKAKLWKKIGHVKNHLQSYHRRGYPVGTTVVEVELAYRFKHLYLYTVAELVLARKKKQAEEKIKFEASEAKRELAAAKKRLVAAKARVKQVEKQ